MKNPVTLEALHTHTHTQAYLVNRNTVTLREAGFLSILKIIRNLSYKHRFIVWVSFLRSIGKNYYFGSSWINPKNQIYSNQIYNNQIQLD